MAALHTTIPGPAWLYYDSSLTNWNINPTLGSDYAVVYAQGNGAVTPDAVTAGWQVLNDEEKWVSAPSISATCRHRCHHQRRGPRSAPAL